MLQTHLILTNPSQLDQHLDLTLQRDAAHLHLENTLVVMGGNYRDPAIPRFPPTVLVNAYNGCLANRAEHFGENECAMELISSPGLRGGGLLNNIRAAPGFFSTFVLHGQCTTCLRQCQMVLHKMLVVSNPIIIIAFVRCIQSQSSTCFFPTTLKVERLSLDISWHLQWQLHCRTSSSVVCLSVAQGKYLRLSMLSLALC